MQEHYPFVRDDVLPSFWANAIQRFLSVASFNVHISGLTPTSLQVPAGSDENAAVIGIEGKWRWNEATVTRAHPGGAAGDYPIWATAADNDIVNLPDPGTDNTNFAWHLAITAPGHTPAIVLGIVDLYRQIGICTWDGAKITAITQTVGQPQQGWSVGDVKGSLQTADHQGWKLADGRTNILRSAVSESFVAAMLAAGYPGDSDLTIGVPDYRGRTLVGLGTHADVNSFTDSDGVAVGSRTPLHRHAPGTLSATKDTTYSPPDGENAGMYHRPGANDLARGDGTGSGADIALAIGGVVGDHGPMEGPAYGVVNWFVYDGEVIGGSSSLGAGTTLLDGGDKIEWVEALATFAELWAEITPAGYVPLHVDTFSSSETFDGVDHVGPWRFNGTPSPVWTGTELQVLWHAGEGAYWREDWGPHNDSAQISAEFTFVGGSSTPTIPENSQEVYVAFGNNVIGGDANTWDHLLGIIFRPKTGQLLGRFGQSGDTVALASTGAISGDMRVRMTVTRQGNNVDYECYDLGTDSVIGSGTFAIPGGQIADFGAGVNLAAALWGAGAGNSFGSSSGSYVLIDNVTIYDVEQESRDIFVAITPSGGGDRVQKRLFGIQGPTTIRSDFL